MKRFTPTPQQVAASAAELRKARAAKKPCLLPPTPAECAAQTDTAMRIVAECRFSHHRVMFPGGWAIAHSQQQMRIFNARTRETAIINNVAAYAYLQRVLAYAHASIKGGAA